MLGVHMPGRGEQMASRLSGSYAKRKGRGDEDEHYHDASKGMGDKVNPSFLAEFWIIATPQPINAICFHDKCGYHLVFMMGKVKWDLVRVSYLLRILK